MLHNLEDHVYHCEYTNPAPNRARDILLAFRDGMILSAEATLPRLIEISEEVPLQFLFTVSEVNFYLPLTELPETDAFCYRELRSVRTKLPQWQAFAMVTGLHLATWYGDHRYCGRCATPLVHKEDQRALVCPNCGHIIFPDIAIAVIVGITDGDRLVLSRYAHGNYRNYALIAGFVEIGEALEDAVRREIMEEVGLRVKNIRYFDNQPWGFSRSLLVGFFCDLDGSPDITVDHNELAEALWMEREFLPKSDPSFSLTAKMMEAFRLGEISETTHC